MLTATYGQWQQCVFTATVTYGQWQQFVFTATYGQWQQCVFTATATYRQWQWGVTFPAPSLPSLLFDLYIF